MADMKMQVNVEPYIDVRKLQSQIDRETKNLKVHAELVITQSKHSQQKILKEIKNYYTQLEQYQAQYASSNSNFYNLELKKNNQYLNNYASLLQKQVKLRSSLGDNSQLAYMKQSDTPAKSSSSSSTTEQLSTANPAAALLNSLQTTGSIVSQFNALLTELSIASSVATANLNQLGTAAFQTTSQCGLAAREYLQIIQDIGNANGFAEQTEQISALSNVNNFLVESTKEYTFAILGNIAAEAAATTATTSLAQSLKILNTAFVGSGFGAALLGVTTILSLFTFAIQKNQQQQQVYLQKIKEQAQKATAITDEIITLTTKYYAFSSSIQDNESTKNSFLTTQNQLLEKLGLEGLTIDELISKYGSLDNAINRLSLEELRNAESDLTINWGNSKKELLSAGKGTFTGTDTLVVNDFTDSKSKQTYKMLYEKGWIQGTEPSINNWGKSNIDLPGNSNTVDGIIENYEKLIELRNALQNMDEFSNNDLADNKIFISINEKLTSLTPQIEAYKQAIFDLNKNLAMQEIITNFQLNSDSIPKNKEEFVSFKQAIQDTLIANNDFAGSEEQLRTAIDNTLASFMEFSSFTDVAGNNMTTLAEQAEEYYKKQNEEIDKFQSSMDSIKTALENVANLSTSDIIDLIQQYNDFNWSDWGVTGVQGVGNLEGALKALATQQYSTLDLTLQQNAGIRDLYNQVMQTSTAFGTIDSAINSLGNLDATLKSVATAYEVLKEKQKVTTSTLVELRNTFSDVKGIDDFISKISDTNSLTEDVQSAFNNLISEYLKTSNVLDNVNASTKDLIISQLTQIGVANAAEIVTQRLKQQKQILAKTGIDVVNVTRQEISELLTETNVSDETKISLVNLTAEKLNYNNLSLATNGDIQSLLTLMAASNATSDALSALAAVKAGNVGAGRPGDMDSLLAKAQAEVNDWLSSLQVKPNANYIVGKNTSSGSENKEEKLENELLFSQELDLAAEKTKILEKEIDSLNAKLENTLSAKEQINTYNDLIKKQAELTNAYRKTANVYQKEYNKSLSKLDKLDESDRKKVESGAYTIEQFSGKGENSKDEKRYNAIQDAIKLRDLLSDANIQVDNGISSLRENAAELANVRWDKASSNIENINSDIAILNEKLNNTTNYKERNKLLDQILAKQKQSLNEQITAISGDEEEIASLYEKINKDYRVNSKNKSVSSGEKIATGGIIDPTQLSYIVTYNKLINAVAENTKELSVEQEKYNGYASETQSEKFANINAEIDKLIATQDNLMSEIDSGVGFMDDNSLAQIALFQAGYEQSAQKVAYIKQEIINLNKEYSKSKGNLNEYNERLEELNNQQLNAAQSMKKYQDDIVSAMKARYDKQQKLADTALKDELDRIKTAKEAALSALNDQLSKFKETIDSRKKALQDEEDENSYQQQLDEYIESISKLESRMSLLKQAEMSGDREAGAERRKLEEELSEERKNLDALQKSYGLDKAIEALDEEYDEYEKLNKQQIEDTENTYNIMLENAQKEYDIKKENMDKLFENEKALIIEAAQLTSSEFSKIFEEINKTLSNYGLSVSSDMLAALNSSNSNLTKDPSSGGSSSTSNKSAIISLLKNGTSKTGDSALNKYIGGKYGSYLTFGEMVELARFLGLTDINSESDVKGNSDNREKIRKALIGASFETGGIAKMSSPSGIVRSLTNGKEDGLAFVQNGEGFVKPKDVSLLKQLMESLPAIHNLTTVFKDTIPNVSNIVKHTNYSSPVISFNLNGGTITKEAIPQFNDWKTDIVKEVSKVIMKGARTK